MTTPRECEALSCTAEIPAHHRFCGRHWVRIEPDLKEILLFAEPGSDQHHAAIDAAIIACRAREGVPG